MENLNVKSMAGYILVNRKSLEGYQSANAGMVNPDIYAHLFKETKYDSFEKAEELQVLRSENYSNESVIKGMPAHVIIGKFGEEMKRKINDCMSDYYSGNKTADDVKQFFEECCTAMRIYCTSSLQTNGYNDADNQQIIGQIFEVFSKENQRAAIRANRAEGVEINREYGGDWYGDETNGYAYYNSFFYYECESMREIFRDMTKEMAQKWEVPDIDTAEIEKNTQYTLDGSLDFNSGWNHSYRNSNRTGSIIDQNEIPPKDFKLFFNASKGKSQWAGIIKVEFDGVSIEREVPFDYRGNDIFNVSELIKVTNGNAEKNDRINKFLRNFEIFTESYASFTRLYVENGNYQRKLI